MLSHHLPNASSRRRGFLLVALLSLTFSLAVYAAQPAKLVSAEAPLYDVRLLLSRPGQSPVMPSLIVRGGERSGIRSDEVEIDLTVTAGNDNLLWIATDIQLDGKPAGEPTLALKSGEPGSISVKRDDGKLLGMLVTGWTYRRFAYHLQESMRRDISEALMKGGDKGKLPVLYTFVFDASGVYGARGTPDVNEKAMRELDVLGKTASGPQGGVITITDRQYGWAAARTPKLGPDIGIAVLRSEI